MDRLKQKRGVLRTAVTKLINEIDVLLEAPTTTTGELCTKLDLLKLKEETLKSLDNSIEALVVDEDFADEIQTVFSYEEKICVTKSKICQKLNAHERPPEVQPESTTGTQQTRARNPTDTRVKLPKLEVPKFNGELTLWTTFWDQFESSIHTNETLHKVDKFKYLKSYLTGKAATAISGLPLTNENYDAAIDILKQRFNQKQLIVDQHLDRLLNLPKVNDAQNSVRLRELYDEIQVRIRSLRALDVDPKDYGVMLMTVLRKVIPKEVTLDYNRKYAGATPEGKEEIENFLDFLKVEVESREKDMSSIDKRMEGGRHSMERRDTRRPFERQTTGALATGVTVRQTDCVLCKATDHTLENCNGNLAVEDKKALLSREGRCFKCGKRYHRSRDCRTAPRLKCSHCGGHHLTVLCEQPLKRQGNEEPRNSRLGVLSSTMSESEINRDSGTILLLTARVWAETNAKRQFVRIMLDGGSQRTFIKESLSHLLDCESVGEEVLTICAFGCRPLKRRCRRVKVWLRSQYSRKEVCVEALETPDISANVLHPPDCNLTRTLAERGMQVADVVLTGITCNSEVQILIGADSYWAVVTGETEPITDKLFAIKTIFGWTVQGPTSSSPSDNLDTNVGVLRVTAESFEDETSSQLRRFWELEHIGIQHNETECKEDHTNEVMDHFTKTITKKDGRYEVSLPWTTKKDELPSNLEVAKTRLRSLTKRLMRDSGVIEEYDAAIRLYEQNRHAEKIPADDNSTNTQYYLPHRAVIRRERDTTKIRIVFDASSSVASEPSLNDVLHAGPNLNPEVLHVLLRFRKNTVALIADIEKAFLQISLAEADRDALRFLWYTSTPRVGQPLPDVEVLRMTRVPFGATSSPFLLAGTVRHHLQTSSEKYPTTCKLLLESFYVDDLVTSVDTVEEAQQLWKESVIIFEDCCMRLRKWATNDEQLCATLRHYEDERLISHHERKVLGLVWDAESDTLRVALNSVMDFLLTANVTKRSLLQTVARIFDPLGILAPFVIKAKILFQRVWQKELRWDESLPHDILEDWQKWCHELPKADEIWIPRSIKSTAQVLSQSVHVFCDASLQAYGAVAYIRSQYADGSCTVQLLLSKSRVAPLKSITLPRLELLGALLGTRLCNYVNQSFSDIVKATLWTDSMIVLYWVQGQAQRYKPFVANRISEIQSHRNLSDWRHCPGKENPADLLTRGVNVEYLKARSVWWEGPPWLKETEASWPKLVDARGMLGENFRDEEVKTTYVMLLPSRQLKPILNLNDYCSLDKIIRVTSWMYRFIQNARQREPKERGPLTTEELQQAERYWIKEVQEEVFSEELQALHCSQPVKSTSNLRDFHPYLDPNGLLRIKGRLQRSNENEEVKHPLILPKQHTYTRLLIEKTHQRLLHSGVRDTLVELREHYWIIQGRQAVKSALYKCMWCKRQRAQPTFQDVAPLPPDRINRTGPFEVTGTDFAGPLFYKTVGNNSTKCYIALFTCAVTRAVHLEVVDDLTANQFLMAFRRFVARRGLCKTIYSDNALAFKRASKDLKILWNNIRSPEVLAYFSKKCIHWKFIIERAAWWGGFWERMVRSVKNTLRRSLSKALLHHDELITILTEIEAIVNSRPLTTVHDTPEDSSVLTPAHFLVGKRLTTLPTDKVTSTASDWSSLNKSYRRREQLLNSFWTRWRKDYLLQLRSHHTAKRGNAVTLKPGDLVLLMQDRLPRHLWKMCRVDTIIPSADGKVRACTVRLPDGTLLRRPVQLLCPLEIV
ncbi:uncharacterized protein LOC135392441 [Ornithodoros turicata]|uniref:uncharacterized protein LOC135392441 n=1 Tax=Ornithodoros turicata TaxID=34597 RepID=UPI003138C293